MASLESALPDFYVLGKGPYFGVLETAIKATLEGHLTPKMALDYAAKEWTLLTKKYGEKKTDQILEKN